MAGYSRRPDGVTRHPNGRCSPLCSPIGLNGVISFGRAAISTATRCWMRMRIVARCLLAVSAGSHAAPAAFSAARRIDEKPAAARAGAQPFVRQGEEGFDRQHGQEGGDSLGGLPLDGIELQPRPAQFERSGREPVRGAQEQQAKRLRRRRPGGGAYARELDRLDMHVYDAAHLLLETHHQECAALMRDFILNVQSGVADGS